QAFRLARAPMPNDFVAMLKDSSLVSVLTVLELTKKTQIFATNLGSWVIPGTLCAGLYLEMSRPSAAAWAAEGGAPRRDDQPGARDHRSSPEARRALDLERRHAAAGARRAGGL